MTKQGQMIDWSYPYTLVHVCRCATELPQVTILSSIVSSSTSSHPRQRMERPGVSRPAGPRGPIRTGSPSVYNSQRPAPSIPPSLKSPERPAPQRPPGLRLKIDGTAPITYYNGDPDLQPSERPAPQKPGRLRLRIDETVPIDYYNGGPDFQPPDYRSPDDAPTLRPFRDTTMPSRTASEPLDSLDSLIKGIDNLTTQPLSPQDDTDLEPDPLAANLDNWSDEVIEELQRLGEGAGGAVHKVKDKRSGKIIARKTITTRQAPRQLLREVHIMTTTQHINIIRFYGAYISPSTSEVKILMEYCEGGSLEAVGKRLRDHGAIVGEKIAGRLAEGVSLRPTFKFVSCQSHSVLRFFKGLLISTGKRLYTVTSSLRIFSWQIRVL